MAMGTTEFLDGFELPGTKWLIQGATEDIWKIRWFFALGHRQGGSEAFEGEFSLVGSGNEMVPQENDQERIQQKEDDAILVACYFEGRILHRPQKPLLANLEALEPQPGPNFPESLPSHSFFLENLSDLFPWVCEVKNGP